MSSVISPAINLLPHQVDHFKRIEEILKRSHVALDSSDTGSGKTFTALMFAQKYNLAICVVCPNSVLEGWRGYCRTYNIEIVDILSYTGLRGYRGKAKNKLLEIRDGEYHTTDYFTSHAERGMLLVYDEVQNLMNETQQSKAAFCLTRAIIDYGPCSRIMALSATPACRQNHCFPLIKALGFCSQPRLYNYDHVTRSYDFEGYGYAEIYRNAKETNPGLALEIYSSAGMSNRTQSDLCYRFLTEVFLKNIRSSMPSPHLDNGDYRLGLYRFSPDNVNKLRMAYSSIYACVDNDGILRANITTPCKMIGMSSVDTIVRLAEVDIARGYKVIVFAEYHCVMDALKDRLIDHRPLILNGKVKNKDRKGIVEAFQEPSWDYPLLISHPKIGGVGIELDDKEGHFPRKTYLIPSYYFIDSIQASGRTVRATSKSRAKIRIVECEVFSENTKILSSIMEKSLVVRNITGNDRQILPCDYPRVLEDEDA